MIYTDFMSSKTLMQIRIHSILLINYYLYAATIVFLRKNDTSENETFYYNSKIFAKCKRRNCVIFYKFARTIRHIFITPLRTNQTAIQKNQAAFTIYIYLKFSDLTRIIYIQFGRREGRFTIIRSAMAMYYKLICICAIYMLEISELRILVKT